MTIASAKRELADLLDRVLELQPAYSSGNSDPMRERGKLIRDAIPGVVRKVLAGLPAGPLPLDVQGKDATGLKSRVPWVRVYSPKHSPNSRTGWYICYLFAANGSCVYAALTQGSTDLVGSVFVSKPPDQLVSRAKGARALLDDTLAERQDLVSDTPLKDPGPLGRAYEMSNVVAFRYDRHRVPTTPN